MYTEKRIEVQTDGIWALGSRTRFIGLFLICSGGKFARAVNRQETQLKIYMVKKNPYLPVFIFQKTNKFVDSLTLDGLKRGIRKKKTKQNKLGCLDYF